LRALRVLFAAVAVLFLVGIAYQVYLAGSALFAGGRWASHADFGFLVALVPLLLVVGALLARAGRRMVLLCVGVLVLTEVQTFLPGARDGLPWLAALHPVNALLVFVIGSVVALRAVTAARTA
jgi:hypothetical protein